MSDNNNSNKGIVKRNPISRRSFLGRTAGAAAAAALVPVKGLMAGAAGPQDLWPAGAEAFRFHMIAHAHIDPVWLWPWPEGMSVVQSTFRSALDRMKENKDFTFIASSARFYEWVAETDPAMLAEIRKRVEEGRWCLIGGWWVEPDINIPSGEALVRQGLYGQMTLQKLFGRRARTAFNPDSFGHTGTLPQIIKSQGMENYIFMRPGPHEKNLPSDLFWWEGADGTKVLTYRIQGGYGEGEPWNKPMGYIMERCAGQPMKNVMLFYGAGDHGGGATKDNIKSIEALKGAKGAPTVMFSTPDRYFGEIRADKRLALPTVKDDLQHHAVGCYTAEAAIKKGNRQAEAALVTAEKTAAVGAVAWGADYPQTELAEAWKKVLFLQFHDSLAGSSLYDHSQAAREGFDHALDTAHQTMASALEKLEWQIPSAEPDCQYLVVFNPHAWPVEAGVEYDLWDVPADNMCIEDDRGRSLPFQWTAGSTETGNRRKLLTRVELPALGYRQIHLKEGSPFVIQKPVSASASGLENEFLKVTFSEKGTIGLFDKETGREVFVGGPTGCRAVVIDDPSDTWSHDIKSYSTEIGAFGSPSVKVLENGPLRAGIRVRTTYGASVLTADWFLSAGSRSLEGRVELDWHEHLKMLKFSFPVDVVSPQATYETAYGHIAREANGNEDPGQRWLDVSGADGGRGLTVFNDAKYGYSVNGGDLRISVARGAVYAHHRPNVLDMKAEHLWMDQGIQTFRLRLTPHRGGWADADPVRAAEEFMTPPQAVYQGTHGGRLARSASFIEVDAPNVVVAAVKRPEEGRGLIIRLVETCGRPARATVDLRFAGKKWTGALRPCEIKTLRLEASGRIRETDLLEE